MITQVHIKNFRGIGDQIVDLSRLTVLVGKNGAGKSTFVDALRLVRDAMTVGLEDAIMNSFPPGATLRTGLKQTLGKEMPEEFVELLEGVEALQLGQRAPHRSTEKQRSKSFEKRSPI